MESGETLLIIGWVIEEGPFHFWSEQCFGYGNRLDRCGEGRWGAFICTVSTVH
jgi:hypothetical protein